MKRIIFLSLLILPLLFSCEKESKDISRITYYATLSLKDAGVAVKLGEKYVEPGFTAKENDVDISNKVTVTGPIDVTKEGVYELTYSILNADGFPTTAHRLVLVYNPNSLGTPSTLDISGVYTGQRSGKTAIKSGCVITNCGNGIFYSDDFFGGYYVKGLGRPTTQALNTFIFLNENNTITPLYSYTAQWGDWPMTNASYNPLTKVIKHTVSSSGTLFNYTLTKE